LSFIPLPEWRYSLPVSGLPGTLAALGPTFDRAVDGWMFCPAIRDRTGRIVDFDISYANLAATRAMRSTRKRLLHGTQRQLFPAIERNGLFEAYVGVVENGTPLHRSIWYDDGRLSGYYDLTVTRAEDGFLVCFTNRTSTILNDPGRFTVPSRAGQDPRQVGVYLRLAPIRAEDGSVVDFVIEDMNEVTTADAGGPQALGRRVTEVFPSIRTDGWFDAYLRVLAGSGPFEFESPYEDDRFGGVFATHMELVDGNVVVHGRNLTAEGEAAAGDGPDGRALTAHVVISALANVQTVEDVLDVLVYRALEAVAGRAAAVLVTDAEPRMRGVAEEHREQLLEALNVVRTRKRRDVRVIDGDVWVLLPLLEPAAEAGPARALGTWGIAFANWKDDERVDLLSSIATQCALAIDRIALHDQQIQLARQLEVERLTLRITLDNLAEGVMACDPLGRVTVVNDAVRQLPGSEQIATDALSDLLAGWPVEDREERTSADRILLLRGRRLQAEGQDVLGAVVALHDVTERRRFERELAFRGAHDPLTGLANRVLLQDRLERAVALRHRDDAASAVLLLDLDRFKVVNDSLGHIAGDALLVEVAARLAGCVREVDLLARLGGDEFVFILDGGLPAARRVWQRVRDALAQPMELGDWSDAVVMAASAGVVVVGPDDRPDDLLRKADQAMYWAKQHDAGNLTVFDSGMADRAQRRLHVEQEIRSGLDAERLTIVWQPIIDLGTGALSGAEALVRLRRTDGSLLAPDDFLDVAEESGLMTAVGEQVLASVLADLRSFSTAGLPPMLTHVNLSASELASTVMPDAVLAVAARLHKEGLGVLSVELTESALLGLGPALDEVLARFRSAGVRLAVDDFGTGWSSLTYLRRLPLDCVKIDRSFVEGVADHEGDRQIVSAVAGLAHALSLESVAEGVEVLDQLKTVRDLGCSHAQGFLFGRPMPRAEFIEHVQLRSGRPWAAC
jgi:diguanylate cyclase (GGDEF)-like protein